MAKDGGQRIRQLLQEVGQRRSAWVDGETLPLWGEEGRRARGGGAEAPPRHKKGRSVGMREGSASRATASASFGAYGLHPGGLLARARSARAVRGREAPERSGAERSGAEQ